MFPDGRSAWPPFALRFPRSGGPVFYGLVGHFRQGNEELVQVVFRNDPKSLAATDQAVEDCARLSRFGTAKKQPVLFADRGGSDRVFHPVVVDLQFGMFGINRQRFSTSQRIVDRLASSALGQMAAFGFQKRLMKLIEKRYAFFLPDGSAIQIGVFPELRLDLIERSDLIDELAGGLAFRTSFIEVSARRGHAGNRHDLLFPMGAPKRVVRHIPVALHKTNEASGLSGLTPLASRSRVN